MILSSQKECKVCRSKVKVTRYYNFNIYLFGFEEKNDELKNHTVDHPLQCFRHFKGKET